MLEIPSFSYIRVPNYPYQAPSEHVKFMLFIKPKAILMQLPISLWLAYYNSATTLLSYYQNLLCKQYFHDYNICAFSMLHCQRCKAFDTGGCYSSEDSDFALLGRFFKSRLHHVAGKKWQLSSSSSISADTFNEVSPERLWEVKLHYCFLWCLYKLLESEVLSGMVWLSLLCVIASGS